MFAPKLEFPIYVINMVMSRTIRRTFASVENLHLIRITSITDFYYCRVTVKRSTINAVTKMSISIVLRPMLFEECLELAEINVTGLYFRGKCDTIRGDINF